MVHFLFLLLLLRLAELDWRMKSFDLCIILPLITLIFIYHPHNHQLIAIYITALLANYITGERFIGNGDIDLLWIGYSLLPLFNWYEWVLGACIIQLCLQHRNINSRPTDEHVPFVPALAMSWLVTLYLL